MKIVYVNHLPSNSVRNLTSKSKLIIAKMTNFKNFCKYSLIRMGSKLKNLRYEPNYLQLAYNNIEMGILCFCALHGFAVYESIPKTVARHGGILLVFIWIAYGFITLISACCLSELTALAPCTGATYHYCYYTICEFFAFLFGWNSILAYSSMILSRCSFISSFIDQLIFNGWLERNIRIGEKRCYSIMCFKGQIDPFVPVLTLSMAFFTTWSVKIAKHIITTITLIAIIIIFVILSFLIIYSENNHIKLWTNNKKSYQDIGETVLFGFIGYETIAVLGEETHNPSESIPHSIIVSIFWTLMMYIIFTVFMAFAVKENSDYGENLETNPLSTFLEGAGLGQLGWLSNVGAILGFWSGTYTMVFTVVRIMYSMSRDGMIFTFFSQVSPISRTPILPTMIYGTILGLVGAFIEIDYRAATFSVALGKAMTSICLLISRYRHENNGEIKEINDKSKKSWIIINYPNRKTSPTLTTQNISLLLIYLSVMSAISTAYCTLILFNAEKTNYYIKSITLLSLLCLVIFVVCLQCQPQNERQELSFTVPSVPNVPAISIMCEFITATYFTRTYWWLAVYWTIIGAIFYFAYSIHHSKNNNFTDSDGERWNPWRQLKKKKETLKTDSKTSSEDEEISEPEELLERMGIKSSYNAEEFDAQDHKENKRDAVNIQIDSISKQKK